MLLMIIVIAFIISTIVSHKRCDCDNDSLEQKEDDIDENIDTNPDESLNSIVDYINNVDTPSTAIFSYVGPGEIKMNDQSTIARPYSNPRKNISNDELRRLIENKVNMIFLIINVHIKNSDDNSSFKTYYKTKKQYPNYRYVQTEETEYKQFKKVLNNSKEYQNKIPGYKLLKESVEYELPEKVFLDELQDKCRLGNKELFRNTFYECMNTNMISLIEYTLDITIPNEDLIITDGSREKNLHFKELVGEIEKGITNI